MHITSLGRMYLLITTMLTSMHQNLRTPLPTKHVVHSVVTLAQRTDPKRCRVWSMCANVLYGIWVTVLMWKDLHKMSIPIYMKKSTSGWMQVLGYGWPNLGQSHASKMLWENERWHSLKSKKLSKKRTQLCSCITCHNNIANVKYGYPPKTLI